MMDEYDGLALTVGALWLYVTSMPEDIYYSMLERTMGTRIILLLGIGIIFFLYGIRDSKLPLMGDTVLSVISLALISSMWKTLLVYTYIPSGHTEVSLRVILILVCFFGGSAAFYGLGGLISKSVRGSAPSTKVSE